MRGVDDQVYGYNIDRAGNNDASLCYTSTVLRLSDLQHARYILRFGDDISSRPDTCLCFHYVTGGIAYAQTNCKVRVTGISFASASSADCLVG
jgi:hypothetical protein